jgi:acetyltransferase
VNLATTGQAGSLAAAQVLVRVAQESDKPIVVFSSTPVAENAQALAEFAKGAVPVLRSPSRAARAVATLADYRRVRERLLAAPAAGDTGVGVAEAATTVQAGRALSESESKAVLAAAGIPVSRDVLVPGPGTLAIEGLRLPLVVKVVSPDIPHKTEVGGVRLSIASQAALDEAIAEVIANARRHVPHARIEGALVSEMVRGGFELIAGVVNDEVFGPVVVVGAGGIYAEVLKDTSSRIAPFDEATARDMLDELRCRPILDGVRGAPACDVGAIASALAALSRFAWAHREQVREVDINPLFALPDGVVAADALVVPL